MKKGEREVIQFSLYEHVDEAKCLVCNNLIDLIQGVETKCDCDPINVCKCWSSWSSSLLSHPRTFFEIPPHGHMRLVVDGDVCELKDKRLDKPKDTDESK